MDLALDLIAEWIKRIPYQGGLNLWVEEEKELIKVFVSSAHVRGRLRSNCLLRLYEEAMKHHLSASLSSGCVKIGDIRVCSWESKDIISVGGILIVLPRSIGNR